MEVIISFRGPSETLNHPSVLNVDARIRRDSRESQPTRCSTMQIRNPSYLQTLSSSCRALPPVSHLSCGGTALAVATVSRAIGGDRDFPAGDSRPPAMILAPITMVRLVEDGSTLKAVGEPPGAWPALDDRLPRSVALLPLDQPIEIAVSPSGDASRLMPRESPDSFD